MNKQKENRVIISREIEQNEHNHQVALMIAGNIDNLERTLSRSGTSHRVNFILLMKGKPIETDDVADEAAQERPSKRKCRQSLPTDFVAREIPYGGKRMRPGELTYVKDLTTTSSYKDKAITHRELYLIWLKSES